MQITAFRSLFLLILLAAGAARAQTAKNEHRGFFLRLDLGGGYLRSSASQAGTDVAISGGAGAFSVNLGGALTENAILSVHVFDSAVSNPSVSVGSQSSSTQDTTAGIVGIGPCLTYYVMPENLYVSAPWPRSASRR
jgi:hypothetical protein